MKIAVSSQGNTLESQMDPRFGRAAWFMLIDPDTMEHEALDNAAAMAGGGAGISAAQTLVDRCVSVVITGNVGPNAMNVLKAAGVAVYRGTAPTVRENAALYQKGALELISATVAAHSGLANRR